MAWSAAREQCLIIDHADPNSETTRFLDARQSMGLGPRLSRVWNTFPAGPFD